MQYKDLRDFILQLENLNELKRISLPIDPKLEMTEICSRVLKTGGPAILFENPKGYKLPVLCNLFGTKRRIALGMGILNDDPTVFRSIGIFLANLKDPGPPRGMHEVWDKLLIIKKLLNMSPKQTNDAPCQECIIEQPDIDISSFPIQTCWPEDAGPLITWGLVVTTNPQKLRHNIGIYRQQVIDKNKVIMRWLPHRGGALDFKQWKEIYPGEKFPVAVALGADPATMIAAVTPIPDTISEYAFAGLLRGKRTELTNCIGKPLQVPASAELVLEGYIDPEETALEGPFGDHTGYYNEVESFPVFTIDRITHRYHPIYQSTYTNRPPDEPAMLGMVLNEIFIPIIQKQFPEIIDFYLPPEGCSYRLAIISIHKQYLGHAKRVMLGTWSFLQQFMYTKFILVVDSEINIRNWSDVIWAITTKMDPARDTVIIENTPIDYLDFASPVSGLGSKIGFDATNKWPGETNRQWGKPIVMEPKIKTRIDDIWNTLGLTTAS